MFRVVFESFETDDEAVALRNYLNDKFGQVGRAHIEKEQERHDWRTWTFK
jgi:hypothetical protein